MGLKEALAAEAKESAWQQVLERVVGALEGASPQVLQDAITMANCPVIGAKLVEDMEALRERGLVDENNVMPNDVRQAVQACIKYTFGEGYYTDFSNKLPDSAPEPVAP